MGEVSAPGSGPGAIWVELLSRQHDVVARHRFATLPVTIGRAYDNDLVVDDPHVAAHHLRIVRAADGTLMAEDLGSLNGLYVDRARERQQDVALDAEHVLRIGATQLRVRSSAHEVPAERPAVRAFPYWPAAIACIVGVFALAGLDLWLSETGEPKAIRYFTPLLILTVAIAIWTAAWSVVTRVFTGHARFGVHFLIVAAGLLGYSIYDEAAEAGAFAWSWTSLATTSYVIAWLVFAGVCFAHLVAINPGRRPVKLLAVTLLAAAGIAMQTLKLAEYRSAYGRPVTLSRLEPPALRMVSPQPEAAFFTDSAALQAKLDEARTEEPVAGDAFGEPDVED
jgi:FHA domain